MQGYLKNVPGIEGHFGVFGCNVILILYFGNIYHMNKKGSERQKEKLREYIKIIETKQRKKNNEK